MAEDPSQGLPQTRGEGCPYLEICESDVVCKATYWGSTQNPGTREIRQHYGFVPSALALQCLGPEYETCSAYKKQKIWEGK